jgi:hypothetical protein
MLTREEFINLYRKHRQDKVLSLYLNAEEHDPAKRRAWRRALDHVLEGLEAGLDPAERPAYEQALSHLKQELRQFDAFLPDRGWAGFATRDALLYAETLPVIMPDLARWEDGLRAAPYVRALKQLTPVTTVLVDSRQARLFRYEQGEFKELSHITADMFFGDLSDVNMSKRATTHTGVRGETDTDAAQRFGEVGTDRLLKHLVDVLRDQAGNDGTIVIGGTNEVTAAVIQRLPKTVNGRVEEESTLSFYMSMPELKRATELAASAVTARRQERLVEQVADLAHAGGRGCLGRTETSRALEERRVEVLLLSRTLNEAEPESADYFVGTAFEQGAEVEEVKAAAADHLDRDGQGIGARLRF